MKSDENLVCGGVLKCGSETICIDIVNIPEVQEIQATDSMAECCLFLQSLYWSICLRLAGMLATYQKIVEVCCISANAMECVVLIQ